MAYPHESDGSELPEPHISSQAIECDGRDQLNVGLEPESLLTEANIHTSDELANEAAIAARPKIPLKRKTVTLKNDTKVHNTAIREAQWQGPDVSVDADEVDVHILDTEMPDSAFVATDDFMANDLGCFEVDNGMLVSALTATEDAEMLESLLQLMDTESLNVDIGAEPCSDLPNAMDLVPTEYEDIHMDQNNHQTVLEDMVVSEPQAPIHTRDLAVPELPMDDLLDQNDTYREDYLVVPHTDTLTPEIEHHDEPLQSGDLPLPSSNPTQDDNVISSTFAEPQPEPALEVTSLEELSSGYPFPVKSPSSSMSKSEAQTEPITEAKNLEELSTGSPPTEPPSTLITELEPQIAPVQVGGLVLPGGNVVRDGRAEQNQNKATSSTSSPHESTLESPPTNVEKKSHPPTPQRVRSKNKANPLYDYRRKKNFSLSTGSLGSSKTGQSQTASSPLKVHQSTEEQQPVDSIDQKPKAVTIASISQTRMWLPPSNEQGSEP